MNTQTILFDLDDTLIHCNKYFISVIERFARLMAEWFKGYPFTAEDFKRKQSELDLAGVHVHGFVKDRFPQSLVETYAYFSELTGRKKRAEEENFLFRLGLSVYEQEYEPYPFMSETLDHLKNQGHELCLYTGGDQAVQTFKVRQMNLESYFEDRIFISPHKTTDVLEGVLKTMDLERSLTWMIGNSARTDIIPALEAGINAIHIPASKEWEYNSVEINIEPRGVFKKLPSLKHVPPTIRNHISGK
ncbi:HAD family hydrolase [Ferviditalea candida]|uniref:HAD family hydrolase n=1 Tax=Ferviditalea candida TaxID=3108399 RepID=A0ABU5ZEY4_9BACL|nr:HAD family hydrolase [Paenibacillaceae bacterium T2]